MSVYFRLAHRAEKPPLQLSAAVLGVDLLVVFDVVQQAQVGAPGAVTATPELLPRAHGVDAAAVLQQDHRAFPHLALLWAEVGQKLFVVLQFGLDAVQKGGGLAFGVGHQQDVFFIAVQGGVQHVLQAHDGGFGVATGGSQRQAAARGRQHVGQGLRAGSLALHHLLLPQAAHFL